jgi:hypothetical protein
MLLHSTKYRSLITYYSLNSETNILPVKEVKTSISQWLTGSKSSYMLEQEVAVGPEDVQSAGNCCVLQEQM